MVVSAAVKGFLDPSNPRDIKSIYKLEHLIVSTRCTINSKSVTLAGLTAASTLKGEQVGVVTVAAQAEVRPPDGVPFPCVKNELCLSELHDSRAQLVALIIHIGDL